jgi:hypothetical protein
MKYVGLTILLGFAFLAQAQSNQPSSAPDQHQPTNSQPSGALANVAETLAAAHQKLEHGQAQEAIAMLEPLAPAGKASLPGAQHELGIAYYRTGKLLPAEKAFAQAMSEDPNDMESVQMRGPSLYRLGRPGRCDSVS